MFGWFQRLLPRTGNFFEMFEAHAAIILAAADATARLLEAPAEKDHVREINEREHDADPLHAHATASQESYVRGERAPPASAGTGGDRRRPRAESSPESRRVRPYPSPRARPPPSLGGV